MSFPGFPDGFSPGWWRIVTTTPPAFAGAGTLDGSTGDVTDFSATYRGRAVTPIAGQQVAGPGIPPGTTILASPAPTATDFTMSQASDAAGPVAISIGTEAVSVAEAKAWTRAERTDQDSMFADMIEAARDQVESDLKRALVLQQKCLYFMAFPWSGYYSLAIRGVGLNPWWFPFAQGVIQLPYPALRSVDLVTYVDTNGDTITLPADRYLYTPDATPGRLQPVYGTTWPVARPQLDAVQITFTCGYGPLASDVPAAARLAMRALVTATYANPEAFTDTGELAISPLYERLVATEEFGYYG